MGRNQVRLSIKPNPSPVSLESSISSANQSESTIPTSEGKEMIESPNAVWMLGDVHGNTQFTNWAIKTVASKMGTVIIQVGDFGYNFDVRFLDSVERTCEEQGVTLYFIDGNHENFPVLYSYPLAEDGTRPLREHVIHLPRGFRWEWHGHTFMALGGATSVDKYSRREGISWWPEEELTYGDYLNATQGGTVDIMITHDCPAGARIESIEGNPGRFPADLIEKADAHREFLAEVVEEVKPKLLICGHYHDRVSTMYHYDDSVCQVEVLDCDQSSMDYALLRVEISPKV